MATMQDILDAMRSDIKNSSFFANRYVQMIMLAILLAVVSGGMYVGYTFYNSYRNQQAQQELSVCIEEYLRAVSGAGELWPTVEMNCQLGYEHNSSSDLAPYFVSLQVQALLHQNKQEDVPALLDTMMRKLSSSSPLYHLYKTQKALIELDLGTENGLVSLQALAEDQKNTNRDIALYYLGLYYWSHDQVEQAQKPWKELVEQFAASPWSQSVAIKLQQVA